MAFANFVPNIWSRRLLERIRAELVHEGLLNGDYQGDAADGNTVKIPSFTGDVTIGDETSTADLSTQDIDGASTDDLNLNQRKYWDVRVNDVDAVQSRVAVMDPILESAAFEMAKVIDTYAEGVLSTAAAADSAVRITTSTAGATDTAKAAGQKYIQDTIRLAEDMDQDDIPVAGRWMVVRPEFLRRIERFVVDAGGTSGLAAQYSPATAEAALRNGFAGRLAGFNLRQTTRVPTDGSGATASWTFNASWGQRAGALVKQIVKTEAFRDQKRFADRVRGLTVYGAKVPKTGRVFGLKVLSTVA